MEFDDFLKMKALGGDSHAMSPYEQFKVGHMQSKRASGVAIGALATGVAGVVVAIGAGAWAGSRAQSAKEVSKAYVDGIDKRLDNIGALLESEVTRRINGDQIITQTVTDTLSGSQQGTLTSTQQAELSQAQQLMFGLSTGEYSRNPQRVALYRDATPCPCPASGCGCNG